MPTNYAAVCEGPTDSYTGPIEPQGSKNFPIVGANSLIGCCKRTFTRERTPPACENNPRTFAPESGSLTDSLAQEPAERQATAVPIPPHRRYFAADFGPRLESKPR